LVVVLLPDTFILTPFTVIVLEFDDFSCVVTLFEVEEFEVV
jgi:hypothetical protein